MIRSITNNCPVCCGDASYSFTSPYVEVWQCGEKQCEHLFAVKVSDTQGMMEYKDPSAINTTYAERNSRLIRWWISKGVIASGMKVLDVGAGTGHILDAVRHRLPDVSISCIEPSCYAKELAERGYNVYASLDNISPEVRFDLVLLVEVIEHVSDPVAFLGKIRTHMSPRGVVFLSTPCGQKRNGSKKTNAYDCREHVQFFNEKSFRIAVEKAGFCFSGLIYTSNMYPFSTGFKGIFQKVAKKIIKPSLIKIEGYSHLVSVLRVNQGKKT